MWADNVCDKKENKDTQVVIYFHLDCNPYYCYGSEMAGGSVEYGYKLGRDYLTEPLTFFALSEFISVNSVCTF